MRIPGENGKIKQQIILKEHESYFLNKRGSMAAKAAINLEPGSIVVLTLRSGFGWFKEE